MMHCKNNVVLFLIKELPCRSPPLCTVWDLVSVQCWHFGLARQRLDLVRLHLLKDQYSNSSDLSVCGHIPPQNTETDLGGYSPCLGTRFTGPVAFSAFQQCQMTRGQNGSIANIMIVVIKHLYFIVCLGCCKRDVRTYSCAQWAEC